MNGYGNGKWSAHTERYRSIGVTEMCCRNESVH